ncbi:phage tail sheath family protein [Anabaena sp. FACHB-709]|uniref:All3325 protein n=3 Tax=Nostocaceae TaxID=1162 RepID=A0ACD6B980_NOSS1|nr:MULTISPECIES: phage tail sheath family protein [Nostocaceae]7B5H_AO Chain AO, All3325 protein [Nostoc sp. PCC 7120 = FACHB-418]7B5H_AP Chain AP, All3325 protein [Nostoc sp. PCC 7120 = FACHB-418]7B5H_AQ Chain AQ, All3325 protein [Nostoc sp. PCC 7120 = FACHB-418]7B5H_BO Chain BO, All3325 protein [Nostoc sp. PCC 7120 = FACHB-418]7B5H_BP Chain BP, All3325 protein [Nostoc sp. PCC 7120 = FACHB-418]7B5H_BQ Chain BQ, All3325 protein [Nostoc sp. PCC 7120 = FACHB-418]7B5H_CO Chain CO, All3325 prote
MPSTYKTPGVYIEEISKFPPSIAQVETAIPAFIGYTQIAKVGVENFHTDADNLILRPVRITSLLEYEQFFGKAINETTIQVVIQDTTDSRGNLTERKASARITSPSPHNLYYSMQAYFANGGGPCYIVSVGPMSNTGTIQLEALQNGLAEVAKEDEVTLLVFPESQSLSDENYAALMSAALEQCANLQDRFTVMDLKLPATRPIPANAIVGASNAFRDLSLPQDNLKYGACYAPDIETIFNYFYQEDAVTIFRSVNGGAEEQDTLTMAGYNPANGGDGIQYALIESAIDQLPLILPPSPLVVGQYARTDNTRGVWKAPANVALSSVIKPVLKITNEQQNNLNVHPTGKSINAIRAFTGKGTLIWGARTLAGNDNEWRYVSVRRFFNMAEESIKKGSEPFVFEPNDANTWTKVKAMIENFLTLQWRAGALAGAKPEQAFYVKIGLNETMTALDILEGRMIVEIGMAVVRPAEFIILKFSHKMQES